MVDTLLHFIISFGGGAVGVFAYSYFREKAKNQATKEDIAKITRLIEAVKVDYAKQLEQVKNDLAQRLRINGFRYEKEFLVLLEIFEILLRFKGYAHDYGSIFKNDAYARGEYRERKSEFCKEYEDSLGTLRFAAEKYRPFYDEEIFRLLVKFLDQGSDCAFHALNMSEPPDFNEHWELARQSSAVVIQIYDEIVEAIRKRVESWE